MTIIDRTQAVEWACEDAVLLREAAAADAVQPTTTGLARVVTAAATVLAGGDAAYRDPVARYDVSHELLAAALAYAHGRSAWRKFYLLAAALGDPEGTLARLPVITRELFFGCDTWQVPGIPWVAGSSGGVMAAPLRYPIWTDAIAAIEVWHHYRAILVEHGIDPTRPVTIVRAATTSRDMGDPAPLRDDYLRSHGADQATIRDYRYECGVASDTFCAGLVQACRAWRCDVLVANGSTLAILADWLRRGDHFRRRGAVPCRLVSVTFEETDPRDAATLIEVGFTAAVCNHMRCWDGGVTFLTCRHGRTHLLEHLVHAEVIDGRLVATDPFALAAPFVRYWAGDHAVLGDKVEPCRCGRWSRPFAFLGRQPFLVSTAPERAITSGELYEILTVQLRVPFQAACSPGKIRVTTPYAVLPEAQARVTAVLDGLDVTFRAGNFVRFGQFDRALRIYEDGLSSRRPGA